MDPETHRETFGYEPIGEDLGAPDFSDQRRGASSHAMVICLSVFLFIAFTAVSFLLAFNSSPGS